MFYKYCKSNRETKNKSEHSCPNWKSDVEVSKENQRKSESKKLVKEEKMATYLEFFSTFLWGPLIKKIKRAPISGINIIADNIGKFI